MTVNAARHFYRLAARQTGTMVLLLAALWLAACSDEAQAPKSLGMVATANADASEAAAEMLRKGGTATDAAIAAQLVLTLIEPQSSGIGGGLFSVYYDGSNGAITTFDGRETAPKATTERLFLKADGKPMAWLDAALGGRPVGVPGVIAALHLQHSKFGKLSWFELFQPAIRLARSGFKVSPRLSAAIADAEELEQDEAASALYYLPDDAPEKAGEPVPAGHVLKNPAYAKTLQLIAEQGPDGFYKGEVAKAIMTAVTSHEINPGLMTLEDLAGYKAVERAAICVPYRVWQVCGMGPPSSGGLTTGMILSMLEPYSMSAFDPRGVMAAHLFAQSSRLAFADRNKYMADMDFVDVPVAGLTDPAYQRSRTRLINPLRDMGEAAPGTPQGPMSEQKAADASLVEYGTSHLAIVDRYGNAVSMTMSVERGFGSRITAAGFVLNNQLTDFSFAPSYGGNKVANRPEGGKRPRSSMSPSIVLNEDGTLFAAVGSPGGSRIIGFTARAIMGVTDWGMTMQEAVSLPHVINRNGKTTEIEDTSAGAGLDGKLQQFGKLAAPLAELGHEVEVTQLNSGLQGIRRLPDGTLDGGADPRREGVVIAVDKAD